MTNRVDRRALFASGAAAALLAAAGVSAGGLPRKGGKLRLAVSGAQRDDSWLQGDGLFMQVARAGVVFDALTEIAVDGTLRPGLATGWRMSADARKWRFELRKAVRFHDGSIFGSTDAAASLALSLPQAKITASTTSITIDLGAPDPGLPFMLAGAEHVIHPAHALGSGIGTGLYAVQHFAPGQQMLAKRVQGHWKDGSAGWFDRVELVSIPSENVRAQALAEYLVDAADIAHPSLLEAYDDIDVAHGTARLRTLVSARGASRTAPFDGLRAAERWWFDTGA